MRIVKSIIYSDVYGLVIELRDSLILDLLNFLWVLSIVLGMERLYFCFMVCLFFYGDRYVNELVNF